MEAGGTLARRVPAARVSAQDESVRVREMRHVLCALSWPGVVFVQGGAGEFSSSGRLRVDRRGRLAGSRRVDRTSSHARNEGRSGARDAVRALCALSWLVHGGATQVKGQGHGLAEAASRVSMLDAVVGARGRVQGLRRPRTSELVEAQMKAV